MTDFILKYWVEFVFTAGIGVVTFFIKRLVSYKKDFDSTRVGVRELLKTRIIEKYNLLIKKKTISIYDKEDILDLYEVYLSLGGNSFVKEIIEKINQMMISD